MFVTAGANQAFALVLATLVGGGDEVVLALMARAPGATAVEAPVADRRNTVVVIGTLSKSLGVMGWRVGVGQAEDRRSGGTAARRHREGRLDKVPAGGV